MRRAAIFFAGSILCLILIGISTQVDNKLMIIALNVIGYLSAAVGCIAVIVDLIND